jgi:hypothetical protein
VENLILALIAGIQRYVLSLQIEIIVRAVDADIFSINAVTIRPQCDRIRLKGLCNEGPRWASAETVQGASGLVFHLTYARSTSTDRDRQSW